MLWQLLLCAIFVVVNAEAWGRTHLCVFIPISERSKKDAALSIAALKTWAKEELQRRAGARVFFVSVGSTRGTPLEAYTVHVPGDLEVGYKRLPVRILKIWHYFSEDRSCDWVMKADSDTYVNLRAVSDRLQCFDSAEEHFFGAVHAIVPPRHLREMWSALYFAHGGSGYMVSRGLLPKIRASAPACLEDMLEMTSGDAMEDVIFALCLQRQLDIQVKSYGFLKPVTHRLWDPAAEPELATQEIVVNFHQARDELLDRRRGPGEPLQRFMHWDAQPPPLHGCIMVAHPVENETDLHEVHSLISRAALAQHHALALLEGDGTRDLEAAEQLREGSRAGHGRCVLTPMTLARQAEVRLSASGSDAKAFWTSDQLATFSRCFEQAIGPVARCDWQSISEQHYGLSFWPMARSVNDCAKACCRSGADCSLFQFNEEEGCWLGLLEYSQAIPSEKLWHGGVKL